LTFSFAPAVRESVTLLIALAGASGSGKTYSALRLAKGMAPTGKIAFIDTEARRGLHYAEEFSFLHSDMRPPFRPAAFIEGIRAAEAAGAEVVIIDSFSHEYDGEGGIIEWADELEASGTKSPGNWKVPKGAHKKLMNALLQCRASIIFCLRADEKIKIARENNKTVVVPLGWMPICEKRFMFEMTASFTLTPDKPGVPHFDLPHKLQRQHRDMFTDTKPIGEDSGLALAEWARGGKPAPTRAEFKPTEPMADIPTAAEYHAQWGKHINSATRAESLGERWASEKEVRRQIEWTDEHPLKALIGKVERAIESLKAPA
jgi:hypothetical protein